MKILRAQIHTRTHIVYIYIYKTLYYTSKIFKFLLIYGRECILLNTLNPVLQQSSRFLIGTLLHSVATDKKT